ncbi:MULTISPECIES: hypothetical protein [unclassified Pedobacter]|uniref:hypothetical protein n=1 Tax=unclassified Pedobacter TaxID=2628915 RepID=UPI00141DDEC8|nr:MULTISPECIES: hypothetical protein [unclassified Pedobacter]NII83634.1 hypothetical protein [Pedobacter sp. SG908]NMN37494.1 hypothetical protein [Pedobacter sp. SG918]
MFLFILYRQALWSATAVIITHFVPVFRFYASLRRTSLLQGNAAPAAKGPVATSIGVDEETVNYKPDCSGKPTAQRGLEMKSRTGGPPLAQHIHFQKQLSLQC